MKFKQTYQISESAFGQKTIIIILSDSYNDLFIDGGTLINCLNVESVKQELNIEENSFAIDNLDFSINESSTITDADKNALSFCLQATDINKLRYIGIFFDSVSIDNKLFAGKIESKVSADDINYTSGLYELSGAIRSYKLSALSFDISILEKAKFNSQIEKEDGTLIDNIYTRINAYLTTFIGDCGFSHKASFSYDSVNYYTYPIAPLWNVINAYLHITSDLLTELLDEAILFNLLETNLDFKVNTMVYEFESKEEFTLPCLSKQEVSETKYQASIAENAGLWISRKFIDNTINPNVDSENERDFTFLQFDNIAEFLSNIAKNLGCFVKISDNGTSFDVEFLSRSSVIDADSTTLFGITDGQINTSSTITSDGNAYYGQGTYYNTDGIDALIMTDNSTDLRLQKSLIKAATIRKNLEDKNISYNRLLFTSSPIIYTFELKNLSYNIPLNIVSSTSLIESYSDTYYNQMELGIFDAHTQEMSIATPIGNGERLFTTLYVINQEAPRGDFPNVCRPIYNISINYNGIEYEFNTLTDYINFLIGKDKQYYETERSVSVPSWNGFDKGGVKSWKNLKLGAKFNETITIRDYDESEVWSESTITKSYVITSIDWDLTKPSVKIKGQLTEKYSFNEAQEITELVQSFSYANNYDIDENEYFGDAGEAISKYDCLVKLDDNLIYKASATSRDGVPIGVALNTAAIGERVYYKRQGIIKADLGFTMTGMQLVVRSGLTGVNYTDDWTDFPTNEIRVIIVGSVISTDEFKLNIKDYYFEAEVPV